MDKYKNNEHNKREWRNESYKVEKITIKNLAC